MCIKQAVVMIAAIAAIDVRVEAQVSTLVSVGPGGVQGDGYSLGQRISADGRYVAYWSTATTLVPGGTSGSFDVFLYDRTTGTNEIVSRAYNGALGNGGSVDPSMSADGRWVAFTSSASNLVPSDANGATQDIFVRDRSTGAVELVSVSSSGVQGNLGSSRSAISADGRFVAFNSDATNLVAWDTNNCTDIFVRDRLLSTTERVSVSSSGAQGNLTSTQPAISGDGRFVGFSSLASNLVAADTNGRFDVFVHDGVLGTTEIVSVGMGGTPANSHSYEPTLSADGRYVVYDSSASNLVAGANAFQFNVYLFDRLNGTTELISVTPSGSAADGSSGGQTISPDGRWVAFNSDSSNLVPGVTHGITDVFLRDRLLGTTERVSISASGGDGDGLSEGPAISADARYVAFDTDATNVIAGDVNMFTDVILRDRGAAPTQTLCYGDGNGTACPCGNSGAPSSGCANSLNAAGASLSAAGLASIASDSFVLTGVGMPNASALYFQGTAIVNAGLGNVFGDGLRCAGGSVVRLGTQMNAGGSSQYPSGSDPTISIKGVDGAGDLRIYQVWYRNADPTFCTSATFNLTSAVAVTWAP